MGASVGRVMRATWQRIVDRVEYASTLMQLWVLDRIAGPEPSSEGDIVRERMRARLRRHFPDVDIDGTVALRKPDDR